MEFPFDFLKSLVGKLAENFLQKEESVLFYFMLMDAPEDILEIFDHPDKLVWTLFI